MKSENWNELDIDYQNGMAGLAAVHGVGIALGAILTIAKLTTAWDPEWVYILLPVYVPLLTTISCKFCYKVMRKVIG